MAIGVKQNNSIYRLFFRAAISSESSQANVSMLDLKTWHERLGHVGSRALRDMVQNNLVDGVKLKNVDKFFCESCQFGKSHKLPFKETTAKRNSVPGEYVHTDVCGPFQVESLGHTSYYVTFIDEASGFCYVYFLKHKDDVFEKFKQYESMVFNKFGRGIKIVRSDNGGEYKNTKMSEYLAQKGILMENTAPHTPQQNGKAERANRTISECARTMLRAKNLPKNLWAEAVNTAVYILNRTTHSSQKGIKTPYEIWSSRKPNLQHIRIFGSTAYKHVPKQFRKKLDDKCEKMILVGYQGESANYRLYDPKKKQVSISKDVIFNEEVNPSNGTSDEWMITIPQTKKLEPY